MGGEVGAEERAQVIVDSAISPFCTIDGTGTITWAGASIEELLGWPADELVGRNVAELLEPASLERAVAALERFRRAGQSTGSWRASGLLVELVHADGHLVSCDVAVATSVRTGLDGFVLQLRRQGAGAHLQRALECMAENLSLRRVLTSVAAALAVEIADARAEIHWDWNGAGFDSSASSDGLALLAGDDPDEPGHRPWVEAYAGAEARAFDRVDDMPAPVRRWAEELDLASGWMQPVMRPAPADEPVALVTVWRRGEPDPALFPSFEVDRLGRLVALALEWERGRSSLRFAAHHDPLTGLANRRTLLDRLRSPAPPEAAGSILFCDVDDFKPVNDQYGHAVGDAVLQVIGERLRQAVRPSDLVVRYGGDEFVVHCPGTSDPSAVAELSDRLERVTEAPISIGAITVEVGLSVGQSAVVAGADVDDVLSAAARDMGDNKRRRKELC